MRVEAVGCAQGRHVLAAGQSEDLGEGVPRAGRVKASQLVGEDLVGGGGEEELVEVEELAAHHQVGEDGLAPGAGGLHGRPLQDEHGVVAALPLAAPVGDAAERGRVDGPGDGPGAAP